MRLAHLVVVGVLLGAAAGWWLRRDAEPLAAVVAAPAAHAENAALSPGATTLALTTAPTVPATSAQPSFAAAAVAAPAAAAALQPPSAMATTARPSGLLLPVQGIPASALRDTFTDARSEGRVHDAIDIMAPTGTPVLAVADGQVEKLFDSERGGLTVYQFEPSGKWCYYYAHLDRYADGLAEKKMIKRGEVIGYVGATGNANADAPHLHFEVHVLGPEKQWWKGASINPFPLLTAGSH